MNTQSTPFIEAVAEDHLGAEYTSTPIEYRGKTRDYLIRALPAGEAEDLFSGIDPKNPKTGKGLRNRIIAAGVAIAPADGGAPIRCSLGEAKVLPTELANLLQKAVLDHNGLGGGEKKDSADESGSGST